MRQGIGVGYEGQPLASRHKLSHGNPGLFTLSPKDGEYEDGGDDGGDEVEGGDDGGRDVDPVLEFVVTSKHE